MKSIIASPALLTTAILLLTMIRGYSAAIVCYAPESCFYTNYNCEDFDCYNDNPPTCDCNELASPVSITDEYNNHYVWRITDNVFQIKPEATNQWENVVYMPNIVFQSQLVFEVSIVCGLSRISFDFYDGQSCLLTEDPPSCYLDTENVYYECP